MDYINVSQHVRVSQDLQHSGGAAEIPGFTTKIYFVLEFHLRSHFFHIKFVKAIEGYNSCKASCFVHHLFKNNLFFFYL